jgi:TonB family protein
MPPTAKELDIIASTPETSGARPADTASRPQPVALEVPVSVNGARTVEGSDKREPFSESTMTVLVFGNGAVIRLASTVVAGQLLFLTNEKTKKEVVCQVVKSKHYSNVSGYVELEFTEAVSGFWGMRFPGERGPAQSGASAPAATAPPAGVAKIPTATSAPKPVSLASKPTPPAPVVMKPAQTSTPPVNAQINLPRPVETNPVTALPKPTAPTSPLGTTTTAGLPRASEAKPAKPTLTNAPAPTASQASTEALKRESTRLQEQLSSMLFTPETSAKPAPLAPTKAAPPAKSTPFKMESTLDVEEVKIPSWLEPLARNATTTTPEAAQDEPLPIAADKAQEFELEDLSAASITPEVQAVAPAEPMFASSVLGEDLGEDTIAPKPVSSGNKGIWIGAIAAGLLLVAAGGAWILRGTANPGPGAATAAVAPAAGANSALQPQPPQRSAGVQTTPAANVSPAAPQAAAPAPLQASAQPAQPLAQPVKASSSNPNTTEALLAYKQLAEPQPKSEFKKPSLGQVRLATPTNRGASLRSAGNAEPALALNESQPPANADAFSGGLVGENIKQPVAPAAPLPVGGDVKAARLLSSISPVYPTLAKSQHVEGDVRVDALIGPDGHVSTMKIVSGPTLLHQAAMEALRQWKYQPATLDGKTVPMHLTVTIQFRLQ